MADESRGFMDISQHIASLTQVPDRVLRERHEKERNVQSINDMAEIAKANLASEVYETLMTYITAFESRLGDEHEVGLRLVSFGQSITFHVTRLTYYNPSLISFAGDLDGSPVELVQNVTQLSFLLMAMRKPDPAQPKRRVGFAAPAEAS